METLTNQIDSNRFRAVLGNYPTGVTVVTGMSSTGEPLGMVVGTFTSVSLDPPLVGFLPMKKSRIFNKLRSESNSFCINILAADQENISHALASSGEETFSTLTWNANPAGNPVIDGVIAWIDCEYQNILDGGDHYIVLGEVKAMNLERDAPPLLFFKKKYGQFATNKD